MISKLLKELIDGNNYAWLMHDAYLTIKYDKNYNENEELVIVCGCEDFHTIHKDTYLPEICSCGVRPKIAYKGTKSQMLVQIENDLIDMKYSGDF